MKIHLMPQDHEIAPEIMAFLEESEELAVIPVEFVEEKDAEIILRIFDDGLPSNNDPIVMPAGAIAVLFGRNEDRLKGRLSMHGINVEGYGGEVRSIAIAPSDFGNDIFFLSDFVFHITDVFQQRFGVLR